MKKAIFLDKDGTIIPDIPYNVNPEKISLYEGVGETLRDLKKRGYLFVVTTNQSGIAKGLFSEKDVQKVGEVLQQLLLPYDVQLDAYYYCPHFPEGSVAQYSSECECRKPKPGMIRKAAEKLDIDITQSWMIGDILNDVESGKRAGCKTIHINNGNETEWIINEWREPDVTVKHFYEVKKFIH